MCFTDPPYNVDFSANTQAKLSEARWKKASKRNAKTTIEYKDKMTPAEYYRFSLAWFQETQRICQHRVIFTPGTANLKMWLNIAEPNELQMHYKPNCAGCTHLSRFNTFEPILVYGKYDSFTFLNTAMNIPLGNGFLRDNSLALQHSSPKSYNLYYYYLSRIKPAKVLDCFCGSGLTAAVCEHLGIPYVCIEIKDEMVPDIELYINYGKRMYDLSNVVKLGEY